MKELAIDTLNKTKVIISRDRKNRPMDNVLDESCNSRDEYDETCPFCRGNEKNIEEETFVINKNSKWIVKSVRNKYPIIDNNKLRLSKDISSYILNNPSMLYKFKKQNLDNLINKLEVLNPMNTLKRGYAIIKKDNTVVSDINNINVDDTINIKLNKKRDKSCN